MTNHDDAAAMSAHPSGATAATALAREFRDIQCSDLPVRVVEKVKTCLFDMLVCTLQARRLSWGQQAEALAASTPGASTVIGSASRAALSEAVFANATMAHGLIQEDIHPPSSTHIGVVVLPALLGLAERERSCGADFVAATVVGYEVAGRLGRALIDKAMARRFRPTGLVGPLGAAAGAARLLELSHEETVSALGFGANCFGGLNEWPHAGGTEVFFHAGFAARNAVTGTLLARLGAKASASALDGRAGLLEAFGRAEHVDALSRAGADWEIMSVYQKPVPACNFVQTACQVALRLVQAERIDASAIKGVHVRLFDEAITYPGCDFAGPFSGVLQAKMSIQYAVASVLVRGEIGQRNFECVEDREIARIARATSLAADPEFQRAFPGKQGAEVALTLADGRTVSHRLTDMIPPSAEEVVARFQTVAGQILGEARMRRASEMIASLETLDDLAPLIALMAAEEPLE